MSSNTILTCRLCGAVNRVPGGHVLVLLDDRCPETVAFRCDTCHDLSIDVAPPWSRANLALSNGARWTGVTHTSRTGA